MKGLQTYQFPALATLIYIGFGSLLTVRSMVRFREPYPLFAWITQILCRHSYIVDGSNLESC